MKKIASTNHQNKVQLADICPMGHALSKIGTRWKPLILFKLLNGSLRFTDLRREIPLITERMLALSLSELENDGLVVRKDFNVFPKKVEYTLTQSAQELHEVLTQICEWGAEDLQRTRSQFTS